MNVKPRRRKKRKGGGFSWSTYWATLISATIENAAPTHLVLTFSAPAAVSANSFTVSNNTPVSGSWTGSVYTLVLQDAIEPEEDVTVNFKNIGAVDVVNNVVWVWYEKALTVEAASIVGIYPHNEPSGTTAEDASDQNNDGTYTGIALAETGIGDGTTSAKYDGVTSRTSILSDGFAADFSVTEATIIAHVKAIDANVWLNDGYRHIFIAAVNTSNYISFRAGNAAGYIRANYMAGGTYKFIDITGISYSDFFTIAITVSKTNDRLRLYVNGIQYLADIIGLGDWTGALTKAVIGSEYGTASLNQWTGWIGPVGVWNTELTPVQVAALSSHKPIAGILFIGDSKTESEAWRRQLCNLLNPLATVFYTESPQRIGISGITTAQMAARCDADIADMTTVPKEISINLGANDVNGSNLAANFETNTRYIVNAYHTAFPKAKIRLTKVWKRDCDVAIALANAIIDELYADYSWLADGIDEATFLEGGDDGATFTSDGVHPNAAGGLLEAQALYDVITV